MQDTVERGRSALGDHSRLPHKQILFNMLALVVLTVLFVLLAALGPTAAQAQEGVNQLEALPGTPGPCLIPGNCSIDGGADQGGGSSSPGGGSSFPSGLGPQPASQEGDVLDYFDAQGILQTFNNRQEQLKIYQLVLSELLNDPAYLQKEIAKDDKEKKRLDCIYNGGVNCD